MLAHLNCSWNKTMPVSSSALFLPLSLIPCVGVAPSLQVFLPVCLHTCLCSQSTPPACSALFTMTLPEHSVYIWFVKSWLNSGCKSILVCSSQFWSFSSCCSANSCSPIHMSEHSAWTEISFSQYIDRVCWIWIKDKSCNHQAWINQVVVCSP